MIIISYCYPTCPGLTLSPPLSPYLFYCLLLSCWPAVSFTHCVIVKSILALIEYLNITHLSPSRPTDISRCSLDLIFDNVQDIHCISYTIPRLQGMKTDRSSCLHGIDNRVDNNKLLIRLITLIMNLHINRRTLDRRFAPLFYSSDRPLWLNIRLLTTIYNN